MNAERKADPGDTTRHAFAIDELTRSIDTFRRTLADLRPTVLADTAVTSDEALARDAYQARRRRTEYFPGSEELFGEPAWDIMLDLFIAAEAGRAPTVSEASAGACTSTHAAQRWIAILEARGMLERYADQQDRRRTLVRLSAATTQAMRRYLAGPAAP